jgi:hypothetical protein
MVARAIINKEKLSVRTAAAASGWGDFGYESSNCTSERRRGVLVGCWQKGAKLGGLCVEMRRETSELLEPWLLYCAAAMRSASTAMYLFRPEDIDEVLPHFGVSIGR